MRADHASRHRVINNRTATTVDAHANTAENAYNGNVAYSVAMPSTHEAPANAEPTTINAGAKPTDTPRTPTAATDPARTIGSPDTLIPRTCKADPSTAPTRNPTRAAPMSE